MENSFFINENQLIEWVEAAEGIKERFGIDKALGCLIGEKFYGIVRILCYDRKMINDMDKRRKKPDYNLLNEIGDENKFTINLDEVYEGRKKRLKEVEDILKEFSSLIKNSFARQEICKYFDSNPRFGPLGHIFSEKEHKFWVEKGAVEHSIETEIGDALIFG